MKDARTLLPLLLALATVLPACAGTTTPARGGTEARVPPIDAEIALAGSAEERLNAIAESYVRLVLAVGEHDPAYVDAYYGPEEWRRQVERDALTPPQIRAAALPLIALLEQMDVSGEDELIRLRREYLEKQLTAMTARLDQLQGVPMTFDEEALALYDAQPPQLPLSHFDSLLAEVDRLLPGAGSAPVHERYHRYRQAFVVPTERLDTLFRTAIAEARRRTRERIELPANERFDLEFVTGKSWSAYNWYQGDARSLIQINTDVPIHIDRVGHLAAHEGYPGHHVYNALLEQRLVRERGWPEYSVYALFSPQSLVAEGTADYGAELAFPLEERIAYERDVLFPLAGIDPAEAERYYRIHQLVERLNYARNEVARRYLGGEIDADEAAEMLTRYVLFEPERARQSVRFIDDYRSYVINYNLGEDLVREYVERTAGPGATQARRWEVFEALLASPRLPSGLSAEARP